MAASSGDDPRCRRVPRVCHVKPRRPFQQPSLKPARDSRRPFQFTGLTEGLTIASFEPLIRPYEGRSVRPFDKSLDTPIFGPSFLSDG